MGISQKSAVLWINTQPETSLLDPDHPNNLCQWQPSSPKEILRRFFFLFNLFYSNHLLNGRNLLKVFISGYSWALECSCTHMWIPVPGHNMCYTSSYCIPVQPELQQNRDIKTLISDFFFTWYSKKQEKPSESKEWKFSLSPCFPF